ncbi:MAG: acetate/propionate family kinase [Gammaproteobacteria bacterium]|jgi:acetate kinase
MNRVILAVNSGSSSIKFALYSQEQAGGVPEAVAGGSFTGIGDAPRLRIVDAAGNEIADRDFPAAARHEDLLGELLEWIDGHSADYSLAAAGHRVVHGGTEFTAPVLIDDGVLERLEALVPLAPLHQPHNLAAVRALNRKAPALPQVACFDTAFHATQPEVAAAFALPRRITREGVCRYGFHGLSYEYIAGVLPGEAGPAADGRVIVAHLGHGASMCAMRERRSIATTMGFTALDGLPMGTRCGALDPGVMLYLMKEKDMDYEALSDLLYRQSGLLGVSGISDDMRELLASKAPEAKAAVDLFVYRIVRETGSLAAALGGLDVLVFTGGIGEHAAVVREDVCRSLHWLGVHLDRSANAAGRHRIHAPDSSVQVFVIPTDEDLMLARHTQAVVSAGRDGG